MPDGHAKCPAAHTTAGCVKLLQTADAPRVPVDDAVVVMMSELLSSWSILKCGMNELFGYACVLLVSSHFPSRAYWEVMAVCPI